MRPRLGIVATIIFAFSLGWLTGHHDVGSFPGHAAASTAVNASQGTRLLRSTEAVTPTATITTTPGSSSATACLTGVVSIVVGASEPSLAGKATFTDPLSGVKLAVLAAQSDKGDPQFSPPAAGHVFAVVQVALTNTGTRTRGYNALDFTLLDPASGQTFPASGIDIKVNHLLASGHLTPRGTVRGALIFDVPLQRRWRLLWDDEATLSPPIAVASIPVLK